MHIPVASLPNMWKPWQYYQHQRHDMPSDCKHKMFLLLSPLVLVGQAPPHMLQSNRRQFPVMFQGLGSWQARQMPGSLNTHTHTPTSTPQLPLKIPHIPTNRDHKALNRAAMGALPRDDVEVLRIPSVLYLQLPRPFS